MVDAVDWTALTSDPAGVRDALHALRSGDEERRRRAYDLLATRLVGRGSRSPASAAAVPALVEVVIDPATPDRFGACQLLRMIAIGDESYRLIERPDPATERASVERRAGMSRTELEAEKALWVAAADSDEERQSRQFSLEVSDVEQERDAARWDIEAYDAVRAHVPALLAALGDDDPAVRLHTAHLLAWFPEERDIVVPALARVIGSEPAAYAEIASVAAVAAALAGASPADTALVDSLRARLTGPVPPERWAASIALSEMLVRPGSDVIEHVFDCLLEAGETVQNWPFLDGDMATLAALTLSRLDPETAPDQVAVMASRLRVSVPGEDRGFLVGALLDAAFPGGPTAELTEVQLTAVRALNEGEVWRDGVEVRSLLAAVGLPDDGPALLPA